LAAITPIQESDLEYDYGSFDSAAFAAQTLSSPQALAAVIDHTLLKPDATREQVENLCDEAIRYRFACAMVNPRRSAYSPALAFPPARSSDLPLAPRWSPLCVRRLPLSSASESVSWTWSFPSAN
jgi:hypothetical protein